MATTRRRVPTRGNRNPTNWAGVVASGVFAVPASTKVLISTFIPVFAGGETMRRLRGTFYVVATSAFVYHGAVGAFVANDTAVAAGVASLLDPVTDASDDAWFWYQSFHGSGNVAGEPGSAGGGAAQVYMIDSKAMRRVDAGYSVAIVVANGSAVSSFNIAFSARLLGSEST